MFVTRNFVFFLLKPWFYGNTYQFIWKKNYRKKSILINTVTQNSLHFSVIYWTNYFFLKLILVSIYLQKIHNRYWVFANSRLNKYTYPYWVIYRAWSTLFYFFFVYNLLKLLFLKLIGIISDKSLYRLKTGIFKNFNF